MLEFFVLFVELLELRMLLLLLLEFLLPLLLVFVELLEFLLLFLLAFLLLLLLEFVSLYSSAKFLAMFHSSCKLFIVTGIVSLFHKKLCTPA